LKNIEIIVIDDNSTDERYKNLENRDDIIYIKLNKNTKEIFGHSSPGHVRNKGIKKSNGKYLAFLDDDDYFMPEKLEKQLQVLENSDCDICCSDAYTGKGIYKNNVNYPLYNNQVLFNLIKSKYKKNYFYFPSIWDLNFIRTNNCIIRSSVVVKKEIFNLFPNFSNGEDYSVWLDILEKTNCFYLNEPLLYYDISSQIKS
jgi:glycosyltransferase involved in cell wall biosynthesis